MLAARRVITHRFLVLVALWFGVATMIASIAPSLITMGLLLIPVGAFGVAFLAGTQGAAQSAAAQHMQGRVMALFVVVFLGSTPIGGMFAGIQAAVMGPRIAFATGGGVSILTALWAWRVTRAGVHRRPGKEPAERLSGCEG